VNEKRVHPLTGDEILLVDHTGKENGYLTGNCPFCNRETLQIIAESENSSILSIVNKFPVLDDSMAQELIIESEQHDDRISTMSLRQVEQLLRFVQQRMVEMYKIEGIRYVSYFRNYGLGSGGTQPHPHSQLYALNYIPPTIRDEAKGFQIAFETEHVCPLCKMVSDAKRSHESEMGAAHSHGNGDPKNQTDHEAAATAYQRVLYENDAFQVIAPYASQFPYELWILPCEHLVSFRDVPDSQLPKLAEVFYASFYAFEHYFTKYPYNMVLHDGATPLSHFRFVIYPRLFAQSGFSLSMGSKINGTKPEKVVEKLKPYLPVFDKEDLTAAEKESHRH
jgi:UDPglucose--hexose-1-phosphate uridylyltransferase